MALITLNRPELVNSLNRRMVDSISEFMRESWEDDNCKFIVFFGAGDKGFCAGGDVKEIALQIKEERYADVDMFFQNEYTLDLMVHNSPKPVVVIADGITMGGGLGIAAGASIVLATERTRMAMPETRIGFFPDVGATGWLFSKSPAGYPEYLSLTGYEVSKRECVRLGLATHYLASKDIPRLISIMENFSASGSESKERLSEKIIEEISKYLNSDIPEKKDMDEWVAAYFAGKSDLIDILNSLKKCNQQQKLCEIVFDSIAQRSPTALVLTLKLLRHNENRPVADVFFTELKAAAFITRHHDYMEGIRARLIDKDDHPRWIPDSIEEVDLRKVEL